LRKSKGIEEYEKRQMEDIVDQKEEKINELRKAVKDLDCKLRTLEEENGRL
jgi:uncharacterized protein YoxC